MPVSLILFGSFARGETDRSSDIDSVLVRPSDVDENEDDWAASIDRWRELAGRASRNRVELLEESEAEIERRLPRTRSVSAAQVRSYLGKIEEFADAAESELEAGRDGAAVEKELRRLLPLKTKAEYDPEDVPISAARKAVDRAQRCVGVARRVAVA